MTPRELADVPMCETPGVIATSGADVPEEARAWIAEDIRVERLLDAAGGD